MYDIMVFYHNITSWVSIEYNFTLYLTECNNMNRKQRRVMIRNKNFKLVESCAPARVGLVFVIIKQIIIIFI